MAEAKKLYIETLGCAMNVRDTEHIIAELNSHENYSETKTIEEADLILINTCSVREKPVAKLFSELGVFNKIKKQGAKIGVCGCTASHLGKDIIKKAPFVNFVLGARNVSKIKDVIHQDKAVEIDTSYDETTYDFKNYRSENSRALINISIGCDKQCTYCIVPATRGKEISIPSKLILDEVKRSVDNGAKEIMLLGQNVNSYGKRFTGSEEDIDFPDLLTQVSEVNGVERIRFTSPHPLHMDDKFMEVFSFNPKVAKHMHMPLQSGSTEVLRAMKRGYTKEWFLERAAKLRSLNSMTTIGTDIIVAFPGESDADFEDTLDVMRQVNFEQVFSFKFSPRPLTAAEFMDGQVDPKLASERLDRLQTLYKDSLKGYHEAQIGKIFAVLVESYENKKIFGKGENYFSLKADGAADMVGKLVPVKAIGVSKGMLEGEIVN